MEYVCGPNWDQRICKINPKNKVGILMSQGLDSATLFGCLEEENCEVIIYNVFTSNYNVNKSLELIVKSFGHNPNNIRYIGKHRSNWPMKNHYPRLCLAMQDIQKLNEVDELYVGNILTPHPQFFSKMEPRAKRYI
jgi:hypothetical protein